MINVYGHKLHIHCVGPQDGKPVVIFEAGGGAFSKDWKALPTGAFVPGKKHGSGTGDRWHGGRGSRYDGPLTPLGRFSKPFVAGPNRIPFFNEESSDDDTQVVAEPEGEERLGTAIAIGRYWTGSSSSACDRNRCGEQRTLRCRPARPRSRTGTPV